MGKIYFKTTAYNAEKTLARCVESVLNQTRYGDDIIYYICDNGSTDRTGEMIREYALKDSRIKVFTNKVNRVWEEQEREFFELGRYLRDDDYYCTLDADDSYHIDFLEKMIPFMKENNLNLAVCGNQFLDAVSGAVMGKRVLPETLILERPENFVAYFPWYHQFMRTVWGKIYSGMAARYIPTNETWPKKWGELKYGNDTLMAFSALRHSERVGIYPEALHDYYISNKSASHKWDRRRVDSDQCLYNDAEDFLRPYGEISRQNREFLNQVYANAVNDTLKVLNEAKDITAEEKLAELERIAWYPPTKETFSMEESACKISRANYIASLLSCAVKLGMGSNDRINAVAKICMPDCASAVNAQRARLFLEQRELFTALVNDDRLGLVRHLLNYIRENKFSKRFDLCEMVVDLAQGKPLLQEIRDLKFLKKHGKLYLLAWQGKYDEALELMTDMLLKKEILNEDFLILYSNLSAILERAEEFVFSKTRLAVFYFSQKRIEECRGMLKDLEEMGVEDTKEISAIRQQM